MKRLALLLLTLALLVSSASCLPLLLMSSEEPSASPQTSSTPSPSAETSEPPSEEQSEEPYDLPHTIDEKNVKATFVSVTEIEGDTFWAPDEGNVYVICKFEIENNMNVEMSVSSMFDFDAYVDDYSISDSPGAEISSDEHTLNGTVAPGKKIAGIIGYELPEDWKTLEIHFTPDAWLSGKMVFTYTNPEI